MFEPARKNCVGGGFDVEKFEAHADSRFDDTDHSKSFDALAFALERDASAGLHSERLAWANETAAEGWVRVNAVRANAGFQLEDFRVGCERIANSIAAVAEAYFVRHAIGRSVVHEN